MRIDRSARLSWPERSRRQPRELSNRCHMKHEADITIILDRSGSMGSIATDVVGGFNHFVTEQRAQPGDCRLTLVQFDDQYEVVYAGRPIVEAPLLTSATFQPRGTTALLDAVGRTIDATGDRLSA